MKALLTILLSLSTLLISAQEIKTGDAEMDAQLLTYNDVAKADKSGFMSDMQNTFGITQKNLDYMFSINMLPGEIYFALELSVAVGKPIEAVVDFYEANRDKGWGYIAQEMGIKPGSPEFHALKGKVKTKNENASKAKPANANSNAGGNSSQKNKSTKTTGNSKK